MIAKDCLDFKCHHLLCDHRADSNWVAGFITGIVLCLVVAGIIAWSVHG